jgi:protein-S-isoprenylcysteine O-methyltransferase Ste14
VLPLVYRDPLAAALFFGTGAIWMASELSISIRKRGGTGENLDRGSRVWVVLLVAGGMAAALGLARLPFGQLGGCWPLVVGVVLALLGVAVRQWAVAVLGRFFTTAVEVQAGHRVVDHGPYAVVRHPSYSGCLMTVVGLSLALGSWLGCAVATVMAIIGFARRISVEERALSSHLGRAWTEYARRRKRLVPPFW